MVSVAVGLRSRRGMAMALGVALGVASAPAGAHANGISRLAPPADIALRRLGSELGPITSMAAAGDAWIYLTLRTGQIVIWDGQSLRPRPFLDLSTRVSCCGSRGLLAIALHPAYASNGLFFVAYTDKTEKLVLARYRRSRKESNRADPASRAILMSISFPPAADHRGGALQFGPDGYLYFGVGDGGSALPCMAQQENVRLGKILRLDVDSRSTRRPFYAIPRSNPSAGSGSPANEVWAMGVRDPWRFSFDRRTGDLYIGDVGQTSREEIDFQPASSYGGENYGWSIAEGSLCAAADRSGCPAALSCDSTRLQPPAFEYGHQLGDCGVVGGYVYRGSLVPGLSGVYLYGDYCSGRIRASGWLAGVAASRVTTFGEDAGGELYLATDTGDLYRIESLPATSGQRMRRDPAIPKALVVRVAQPPAEPPSPRPEWPEPLPQPEGPFGFGAPPTPLPAPAPTPIPPPIFDVEPEPPPESPQSEPTLEPEPLPAAEPVAPPTPPPPTPAPPTPAPPTPAPRIPDREPPKVLPHEQPSPHPVEPRR